MKFSVVPLLMAFVLFQLPSTSRALAEVTSKTQDIKDPTQLVRIGQKFTNEVNKMGSTVLNPTSSTQEKQSALLQSTKVLLECGWELVDACRAAGDRNIFWSTEIIEGIRKWTKPTPGGEELYWLLHSNVLLDISSSSLDLAEAVKQLVQEAVKPEKSLKHQMIIYGKMRSVVDSTWDVVNVSLRHKAEIDRLVVLIIRGATVAFKKILERIAVENRSLRSMNDYFDRD